MPAFLSPRGRPVLLFPGLKQAGLSPDPLSAAVERWTVSEKPGEEHTDQTSSKKGS